MVLFSLDQDREAYYMTGIPVKEKKNPCDNCQTQYHGFEWPMIIFATKILE